MLFLEIKLKSLVGFNMFCNFLTNYNCLVIVDVPPGYLHTLHCHISCVGIPAWCKRSSWRGEYTFISIRYCEL